MRTKLATCLVAATLLVAAACGSDSDDDGSDSDSDDDEIAGFGAMLTPLLRSFEAHYGPHMARIIEE